MKHHIAIGVAALCSAGLGAPAAAEVIDSNSGGFATRDSVVVAADRRAVWAELVHPENWWSHTWSDNSANLRLDAHAGGCFCETIPSVDGWPAGSVEHGRVITIMPGRVLRLSGSLGPLQEEGLVGTVTVTLEDVDGGTRITWDYITGGQARFDVAPFAPVVDGVQSEFLGGLVQRLGGPIGD